MAGIDPEKTTGTGVMKNSALVDRGLGQEILKGFGQSGADASGVYYSGAEDDGSDAQEPAGAPKKRSTARKELKKEFIKQQLRDAQEARERRAEGMYAASPPKEEKKASSKKKKAENSSKPVPEPSGDDAGWERARLQDSLRASKINFLRLLEGDARRESQFDRTVSGIPILDMQMHMDGVRAMPKAASHLTRLLTVNEAESAYGGHRDYSIQFHPTKKRFFVTPISSGGDNVEKLLQLAP